MRRHIDGRAYDTGEKLFLSGNLFRKPKISNLKFLPRNHDILRFEIAMDDALLHKLTVTHTNLLHAVHNLSLRQPLPLLQHFLEGGALAVFLDDVDVIGSFLHFDEPDYVGMFEFAMDKELSLEGLLHIIVMLDYISANVLFFLFMILEARACSGLLIE